jgi:hypothetical protein
LVLPASLSGMIGAATGAGGRGGGGPTGAKGAAAAASATLKSSSFFFLMSLRVSSDKVTPRSFWCGGTHVDDANEAVDVVNADRATVEAVLVAVASGFRVVDCTKTFLGALGSGFGGRGGRGRHDGGQRVQCDLLGLSLRLGLGDLLCGLFGPGSRAKDCCGRFGRGHVDDGGLLRCHGHCRRGGLDLLPVLRVAGGAFSAV